MSNATATGGGYTNHVNPFYIEPYQKQGAGGGQYLETEDYYDDDEDLEEEGLLNDNYSSGDYRPPSTTTRLGYHGNNNNVIHARTMRSFGNRHFHHHQQQQQRTIATPRTERRIILTVVTMFLFLILWMANRGGGSSNDNNQQQEQQEQQDYVGAWEGNTSSSTTTTTPMTPYPHRVILVGERHSGVEFYKETLQACFPNLVFSTSLTRDTWWFQNKPNATTTTTTTAENTNEKERLQFILVVRDPYTWIEAMRRHPLYMPSHQKHNNGLIMGDDDHHDDISLPWKTFVEKPWTWTWSNTSSGTTTTTTEPSVQPAPQQPAATENGVPQPQAPQPSPRHPPQPHTDENRPQPPPVDPAPSPPSQSEQQPTTRTTIPPVVDESPATEPAQPDTARPETSDANSDITTTTNDSSTEDASTLLVNGNIADDEKLMQWVFGEDDDSNTNDDYDGGRDLSIARGWGECQLGFDESQVVPCHVPSDDGSTNPDSPVYELDPATGAEFANILALRAAKIKHFALDLPDWYKESSVGPLVMFHYEHNLWASLERLAKVTGWTLEVTEDGSGSRGECHKNLREQPPPLEQSLHRVDPSGEYSQYLEEQVDWSMEQLIGYDD